MEISKGTGRPASGYYIGDERVPSVTTITGRFKESGGLVHWAWQEGKAGRDYKESRDAAGSAGSMAHAMIEAHIHGKPQPEFAALDETLAKAKAGYGEYLNWRRQSSIEIIGTEIPMVSKDHKYGGTLDAEGRENDEPVLLDWKTSKGRYADFLIQLAAYRGLWEENAVADELPFSPQINRVHLLWLDKETASFAHFSYSRPVMDKAWRAFLHLRDLYEIDKELKRLV